MFGTSGEFLPVTSFSLSWPASRPGLSGEYAASRQSCRESLPGASRLISRRPRACGANQPIRLFQNVGICRLFSRKKADHHERRAKYQAYQHNFPVGASVYIVKRTRHKTPLTQRGSWARLAGDHFRTASQRLENGFVEPPQWVVRAVAHNRERSSAFLAANSSDERMPLL